MFGCIASSIKQSIRVGKLNKTKQNKYKLRNKMRRVRERENKRGGRKRMNRNEAKHRDLSAGSITVQTRLVVI
ncbi:hypothetical protein FRACYDRAFT_267425 [Fragilariopsis cylindrus CCMP1102]|uniref:Uncharacterized protein n=1 Tax=Fragilariopsis cylindrus CCMP1102 TaxID=635003 RepID=A0A1E7FXR1_9STRA|nr:hypothetical protein FRACYDRAFT_267425 [Fragilariopsis cylindrus CCMP1102]|eukprot:OEU22927.1 hypothetical protein FRACYDRAFT_267425 [Fragilariopsis cylindrus CCMP1102]